MIAFYLIIGTAWGVFAARMQCAAYGTSWRVLVAFLANMTIWPVGVIVAIARR